ATSRRRRAGRRRSPGWPATTLARRSPAVPWPRSLPCTKWYVRCTIWYVSAQSQGSVTRATLLDAAVDFAAGSGLADVSLRQMAAALGTSHRMLIYHFGSKEDLLVAVVDEVERRQREAMAALGEDSART